MAYLKEKIYIVAKVANAVSCRYYFTTFLFIINIIIIFLYTVLGVTHYK